LVDRHRAASLVMLTGATVFATTLYAMAVGAPRWLGAITPIGGAALIASWTWVALSEWRAKKPPTPGGGR
jgi:uncharacterized membrane protein YgdD (TMEM256/DUF423 family)